jgi:hypothetical protein
MLTVPFPRLTVLDMAVQTHTHTRVTNQPGNKTNPSKQTNKHTYIASWKAVT